MKEKLNELRQELRRAYDMTEDVSARGVELDRLAAARQSLREAFQLAGILLENLDATANAGEGNHG